MPARVLVACAVVLGPGRIGHGACNVVAAAAPTFRSTLATVDRPFARPGDWVRLTLDPACHGASPGFAGRTARDVVVTVVFAPPGGRPRNVAVVAEDCAALEPARAACEARPDVDRASCVLANPIVPGGETPISLQMLANGVRFRFPDTDALFTETSGGADGQTDDRTFTGPARIAVTAAGDPLPCALASAPCAAQPDVLACLDELFTPVRDDTCGTTPDEPFSHFTALPPPNNYQALCTDPASVCSGLQDEIRFTIDTRGNVLIPMDWRGILLDRDAVPVARLLRASTTVEAFEGRGTPIFIPDLSVLASYAPEGVRLPPLFDPQHDPAAAGTATFFGSADAPETVLRVARHDAVYRQCAGGSRAGLACTDDTQCSAGLCAASTCVGGAAAGDACTTNGDCPDGECGPGLFDFTTRLAADVGPVVLALGHCIGGASAFAPCLDDAACPGGQCGSFTLAALDPVPLDGLNQTESLNAFVMEEAIVDVDPFSLDGDLNGDGDETDHVVKLGNRVTGTTEAIGTGGAAARAVTRVSQPPFSFPAVAADGDVLAFLEPEPLQAAADANGDGDVFDTLLKVFRLGAAEVTNPAAPLAVDAAPIVNGRSLAISDGTVFFRLSEAAGGQMTTIRASVGPGGIEPNGESQAPALSYDGRFVAFVSDAPNLVAPTPEFGAFVHDLATGTTTRLDVDPLGNPANARAGGLLSITADGSCVAFESRASNLVTGSDTNGTYDIFVRCGGVTERVSVGSLGQPGNGTSSAPSISADGCVVAFASQSTNLDPRDTHPAMDLYVRDRCAGTTTLASVSSGGIKQNGSWPLVFPAVSGNGRFVGFASTATNLVAGAAGLVDIYVHDRTTGTTTRVSVDSEGNPANNNSGRPSFSHDGRFVVYESFATNLVPGDTNGQWDTIIRDRDADTDGIFDEAERGAATTTFGSVHSAGSQVGHGGTFPRLSADGRYVVFENGLGNLGVPGGPIQIFLHDRLTSLTTWMSVDVNGTPSPVDSSRPVVSGDGRVVAFHSAAPLVPPDTNGRFDVFVRMATSGDITGDGDVADTVLATLDVQSGTVRSLCPAGAVAVAGGRAAFLRPEAAGDAPGCPSGPSLNGDTDDDDEVVHLWNGSAVQNLGRAAAAIALSESWLAALVDEAAQGAGSFNGDADIDDLVVQVHPASGGGWSNLGLAADTVAVAGATVAFITPESAEGGLDLNGDGDAADRVLGVYDAQAGAFALIEQAAEDMVVGRTGLVAFRTSEAAQAGTSLNADGDALDEVLQVWDPAAGGLLNSGLAVTPCRLEACDPRVPYRVADDTVTFLTFELDQGADLNQDGDQDDLVLQLLNVRQAGQAGTAAAWHTLASASAGICTDTAAACVRDLDCPAGSCFVPPGGCLLDVGTACDPHPSAPPTCPAGQFCKPRLGMPGAGSCHEAQGPCRSSAECATPAACNVALNFNRLVSPIAEPDGGGHVFTGSGRCVEVLGTTCAVTPDCLAGEYCEGGSCRRDHGACDDHGDCPPAAACEPDLVIATMADRDHDEVPDALDNCPDVANVLQADADADGVGDACDPQTGCTAVDDPKGRVRIKTRDGTGYLRARIVVPLGAYANAPVTVSLRDGGGPITGQNVGALPAVGSRGTRWRYQAKRGLVRVALEDLRRAGSPGAFRITARGRRWFASGAAEEPAATTELRIQIGDQCFSHAVTEKH